MSSYTKCENLRSFFEMRNTLTEKGLTYVENRTYPPKSGCNFVKQNGFLFSTCSEFEYEQNNQSDEPNI